MARHRLHALAGVALALLVLPACVGIPTQSAVVAGPAINEDGNPDFISLAQGPTNGDEQEDILEGFLQAANSPQDDYQIAREFLAESVRESWNPDLEVLIRIGASPVTRTADHLLQYSFRVGAWVDSDGRYQEQREPVEQVREFGFIQENGQWRISSVVDGLVVSQNSFNSVFDAHPLYFFDPAYRYLVPDIRWFPSRATIPTRIVRALLAGPSPWLSEGVVLSVFPVATELGPEQVTLELGTATVDLSGEASSTTALDRERMRQQILATLGSLPNGVSDVVMTVGGVQLTIPQNNARDAEQNPTVGSAPLVVDDGTLGFAGSDGVSEIDDLSDKILAVDPVAVTLNPDENAAAVLGAGGAVYFARTGDAPAGIIDARAGLVAPAVDSLGYIWSAPSADARQITVFDFGGNAHVVDTGTLPSNAVLTSFDISRDGARVLLYLQTDTGPQLSVAGILREDSVPVRLGELLNLPVDRSTPVDSAWIDDRTVATLSQSGESTLVAAYQVGGPSQALGSAPGATTIAGINRGTDGIRVLAAGRILRPQGSGSWQDTRLVASVLGTQQ